MDQMNALRIIVAATDHSDFRPGLVEACRILLAHGIAAELPGRYGRLIYAIMTNPSVREALEEVEE